jgi:Porin subfamily
MTLIKSILLGSAAGIVAVAGAQAADLPTKKAAPVAQYVKICNVGGITGWTLPGSDTCVKLSGYITAQVEGGNLSTQYNWGTLNDVYAVNAAGVASGYAAAYAAKTGGTVPPALASLAGLSGAAQVGQRVLIGNSDTWGRDEFGWTTRVNFGLDIASNTAYGPLIGHFDINSENGSGFDNTGGYTYLNEGYLTWAGITAGKAASFFSFTGGGDNWANFFSPDQKGFNEPDLLAYTASFGGGFSATLALQSPGCNGGSNNGGSQLCGNPSGSGSGTDEIGPGAGYDPIHFGGQRWPDIVGALHVTQGWGEAQLSGVLHNVNVEDTQSYLASDCGLAGDQYCNAREQKTGWAIDAGVKINLPSFGAGDNFLITGDYGQSATWYSGLTGEAMWGEWGQVNGNGQPMFLPDAYFNAFTNQWSTPTTWSVSALFEHHFTPQFYIDLEGSVGGYSWNNMGGGCYLYGAGCGLAQFVNGALSPHGTAYLIGADIGWNPVTNLNFDLELMYEAVTQAKPSGFIGTYYSNSNVFLPGAWEGNSSGFAGRFRITRYF